jgi:hypothetical protein
LEEVLRVTKESADDGPTTGVAEIMATTAAAQAEES